MTGKIRKNAYLLWSRYIQMCQQALSVRPGAKHNSPRTGMPKRNAAIVNVIGYACSRGVIISAVRT